MKKGAHGKKPGALRAPGSTQLPHNVLYYKHYLQLFNTEKVFSPWQPIWKRCEDRNDSDLSQKRALFPSYKQLQCIWPIFFLFYPFQTMSISMYFGVSWLDPRLNINHSATEWYEVKTGPKDVSCIPYNFKRVLKLWFCFQEVNVSPESLKYIWYPELEIYGLERFGRQRVLKEMSGVRIRRNRTIHYELG